MGGINRAAAAAAAVVVVVALVGTNVSRGG